MGDDRIRADRIRAESRVSIPSNERTQSRAPRERLKGTGKQRASDRIRADQIRADQIRALNSKEPEPGAVHTSNRWELTDQRADQIGALNRKEPEPGNG